MGQWREAAPDPAQALPAMRAANPTVIARNHRVEQAIQAAYAGDYAPFHRLTDALADPYAEDEKRADLELPPTPDEMVHETFCGT